MHQLQKGTRKQRGETVRFVLLQARNLGVVTKEKWDALLSETSERLKMTAGARRSP